MKKKIDMQYIILIIIIVSLIGLIFYMENNTKLKNFKEDVTSTKKFNDEKCFDIEKVKDGEFIIKCKLKKSNLEKEKYFNYVSGEGEGYKLNYVILAQIDGNYYKIKTLKTGENPEEIELSGYVKNKKINGDTKISLYDVNKKEILEY